MHSVSCWRFQVGRCCVTSWPGRGVCRRRAAQPAEIVAVAVRPGKGEDAPGSSGRDVSTGIRGGRDDGQGEQKGRSRRREPQQSNHDVCVVPEEVSAHEGSRCMFWWHCGA
ncbi:hypothetical protein [Salmonella enterica]|uniref:hypothetical protein n=1 Tax=Salmonella enterica TaxID=28901 RepID=UPI001F4660CF|nr:hypothetical protein [Salmonella enterica]